MKHMVSGFRRSLSLPTGLRKPPSNGQNLRSISLPCRFHPLISQLDADLLALGVWMQSSPSCTPIDGLTQLDHLHASIDNLLHLPHALDTLRRLAASWTDQLRDDFLRLADAYHTFRCTIISLRQHQSSTHAALRRGDDARIASCILTQRRAEQELSRLASLVRETPKTNIATQRVQSNDADETELVGFMMEAVAVTFAASAIVFSAIAAASSSAVYAPAKKVVVGPFFGRKVGRGDDEKPLPCRLERLEELIERMAVLEEKSEGMFRSLINTRISLLNILNPSL